MTRSRLAVILSIDVVGYSGRMERDAQGTLRALNAVFRTVVRPLVAGEGGRIVKLLGDGALVEFPSAGRGLAAAVAIQRRMADAARSSADPVRLRIGLNAGDALVEGEDLFGDCVNVAQRLQAAAEPGGILVSGPVAALLGESPFRLRSEGLRNFRNIARPVETWSVDLGSEPSDETTGEPRRQDIRFCRSADGVSLAWAETGDGPPLVKAPNWITHLELDWRGPRGRGWLRSLSARYRLIRYDGRGNGLSARDVPDISFDRFVDDLQCVFDAAGIERAPIFALSQGCAIAAAFAARAPERVSGIVMLGGFAQGRSRRPTPNSRSEADALRAMIDAGWNDPYPSLRDLLAERIMPLLSVEERRQFAEEMREMISGETLIRYRDAVERIDVTGLLGRVRAPCLVMHCTGDRMQPVEQGRALAAGIPNARFVAYDSPNHVITANDPCWPDFERDLHGFLAEVTSR